VRPQARPAHQRESGSSSLQHVEHTPQRLRINAAADADTILAGKINLDGLRDSRWLRGDGILSRCNQHRDQLRSRRHGRPTRVVAIALAPIEYLVRVHVILPTTIETDEPGANDAATISRFSASGHERLRGRPVAVVPITDFVDTSCPHNTKNHITFGEMKRFRKAALGGG